MDIAKIRKKFKEAQQGGASPADEPVEGFGREAVSPPPPERQEEERPGTEPSGALPAPEETPDPLVELLTFTLKREEFAFRIADVQEIIRPQRITPIPKAGAHLLGITSLRGKVIPVIDLAKMLTLDGEAGEEERKQKILILRGPRGPLGALIDRVVGVIRSPASGIVETPGHLPEVQMKFIDGVAVTDGRFISVLRLEEVIAL
ncbi:MAG: chemotaxis protein CheW [Nitrospirae bacterium]|nr:chemotaxis protein CheW [Nitrospirota bacterium]